MSSNKQNIPSQNCTNCTYGLEAHNAMICCKLIRVQSTAPLLSLWPDYTPVTPTPPKIIKNPCKTTCSDYKPAIHTDLTLQQCAFCTHHIPQKNNGTLLLLRLFLINTYCMNANKKCSEFKLNQKFKEFMSNKQR